MDQTITNKAFDRLHGTWKNELPSGTSGMKLDLTGWNFISQPKLGGGLFDDFQMTFNPILEINRFERLEGTARNIGIGGDEGHWQAMKYEVDVMDAHKEERIHHEMGYFLLGVKPDGTTREQRHGAVIRQASIPRANSFMTTGVLKPGRIADAVATDSYGARPKTKDRTLGDKINNVYEDKKHTIIANDGPNFDEPLKWLQTKLDHDVVDQDWVFSFRNDEDPTHMAHGQRVRSPVWIGNLLSDFWVGTRNVNGKEIEVLQYAQVVNLIFHGVEWPHVAVNTLVKQ